MSDDLKMRLRNLNHLTQGDGLTALITTCEEASQRIAALEAQVAELVAQNGILQKALSRKDADRA